MYESHLLKYITKHYGLLSQYLEGQHELTSAQLPIKDRRGSPNPGLHDAGLIAVGGVVQVYRVGDSGARAVWNDRLTSSGTTR